MVDYLFPPVRLRKHNIPYILKQNFLYGRAHIYIQGFIQGVDIILYGTPYSLDLAFLGDYLSNNYQDILAWGTDSNLSISPENTGWNILTQLHREHIHLRQIINFLNLFTQRDVPPQIKSSTCLLVLTSESSLLAPITADLHLAAH